MRLPSRRVLLILGFLLAVLVVGTALFFVFFRSPSLPTASPEAGETGAPSSPSSLPSSGEGISRPTLDPSDLQGLLPEASPIARGGITATTTLINSRVEGVKLNAQGNGMNYYDPSDGRFYVVDGRGEVTRLSDTIFAQAESIVWNANGSRAAIEFPDGSNVLYNFETGRQTTLPAHWEDFHFTPTTQEIVAKSIGLDPRNRSLVVMDEDGNQAEAIQDLGRNADRVLVAPSPAPGGIVAFSDTGENQPGFGRRMWIPIGRNHENLRGVIVEGFGFTPLWSPEGSHLVYSAASAASDFAPQLWVSTGTANAVGSDRRSIPLRTWADKCTFAGTDRLYCAVPRDMPERAGLQRSLADRTDDDIWSVDILSGRTSLVARPERDGTFGNLQVSEDGNTLFFVNERNGTIQQLRLR